MRANLDRGALFCEDRRCALAYRGMQVPEVGELLASKYRVLSLLGAGGMGSVYRAENVLTGKQVALKWMHPQYAQRLDAAERLIREARAASRLSHPNVVDVYDVIQDDQTLFLVMELLHGESLRDYLRKQAQPPLHELIALLLGAMSGVAAAHAQGVIHRDLKPDNIFLLRVPGTPRPVAKVLDFGIAKLAELAEVRGSTLTQTGAAIGTPVYMSFEQLRGDRDIDVRVDVYAFGVMLYEAFAGHPPFAAASLSELAIKLATTEATPIKSLRHDTPSALAAIIDRAIRRDRAERWPDIPSLMQQLTPFGEERSFREAMTLKDVTAPRVATPKRPVAQREPTWAATAPLPATRPAVVTPNASDSLIARELAEPDRSNSNPLPVWVAAAALLAVAAVAAYLLLDAPAPPAQTYVSPAPPAAPVPVSDLQIEPVTPPPPPPPSAAPEVELTPLVLPVEVSKPPRPSGRKRRAASAPEPPAKRSPQLESPPPKAKPKNADDMLGF
jgi:eukaryotic-like serine/threonine-protein kinase